MPNVGLWTVIGPLGVPVLAVTEFLIRQITVGPRPGLKQAALVEFNRRTHTGTLGVVPTDTARMAVTAEAFSLESRPIAPARTLVHRSHRPR